jgi:hypothetical protein
VASRNQGAQHKTDETPNYNRASANPIGQCAQRNMKKGLNNIEHAQGQTHQKGTVATWQALCVQTKYRQKQEKAEHTQAKYARQG